VAYSERVLAGVGYAESFRGADHLHRILAQAQVIVDAALAAPAQQPETASKTNLEGRRR